MNESKLNYHSREKILKLQESGVKIPDMNSVYVGQEVKLERIYSGCTIHPLTRITGSKTHIHSGAQIGVSGPATLENSWVGENAIVGNLGSVTLKNTVLGPQTILGAGAAEHAVFLGKETMVNDFTTGYGFRIRKGSLYEEDASSAQHTDTKMTVLFPWTTLGSSINFCDALLAGGTGPGLGFFSEVGSGTIHFNFSIRGDKATASLFGDVSSGVFLDQERLFIGGNNCLLGPIKASFGSMTAAGVRINGSLSPGLHFGHALPKGKIDYDQRIYLGASGIVTKQVDVLAELTALFHWYQQIRIGCVALNPVQKFLYDSGLRMVELNYQERLAQLNLYVNAIENSLRFPSHSKKVSKNDISEQKHLLEHWPNIEKQLVSPAEFELMVPESLTNSIRQQKADGKYAYTELIQGLSPDGKQKGKEWLKTIADSVRIVFAAVKKKEK